MATEFTMPKLGEVMEEGTIHLWKKKEGEPVRKGEILVEIETDKAIAEVESPEDGVLQKILAAEGATLPVNAPIAVIG